MLEATQKRHPFARGDSSLSRSSKVSKNQTFLQGNKLSIVVVFFPDAFWSKNIEANWHVCWRSNNASQRRRWWVQWLLRSWEKHGFCRSRRCFNFSNDFRNLQEIRFVPFVFIFKNSWCDGCDQINVTIWVQICVFVVGISLPCHIDIFTASTKLSNGKLLSDSLIPQEADVMSFLQGDQAQPLTWGGDGLGVLPRWRCFFFRFLTHSQVDKSPDFQLTLTSGVRILSKGFALLDNNTTTLPQKLWKKANSGMSTKCLYLLRSISVEIQPRNSGFKIAHWRGDLTSKRTCLVPKRCFKRIILDVYVQVTTISLRYSYSLRIPFVYKNYIYSTGDVI